MDRKNGYVGSGWVEWDAANRGEGELYLNGNFTFEQLIELARELGKDKFVVDVSARPELSSGGDI